MNEERHILADGRWTGPYGIGRFSTEILSRLKNIDVFSNGPKPLSLANLLWLPYTLHKQKLKYKAVFAPGFNPIMYSPIPFVFTICDLIHLHYPGKAQLAKKLYYECLIKPAVHRAHKIITISEFSKNAIIAWAGIAQDKVIVVNCGISACFNVHEQPYTPSYPYLLHVGNTKPHKNILRLFHAFSLAKIDKSMKLILTGKPHTELNIAIKKYHLENKIVFSGTLSEIQLAQYYRGAQGVVFPSLYEGFGLPVLEAMACGTPVLTSNVTSLPEIAGEAALLVNPYEVDAIKEGIEQLLMRERRKVCIARGFERIKLYSWDKTAEKIQNVLDAI